MAIRILILSDLYSFHNQIQPISSFCLYLRQLSQVFSLILLRFIQVKIDYRTFPIRLMNQESIYEFIRQLNTNYIGPALVFLLLGTGIFFTLRLHFVPRYYVRTIQKFIASPRDKSKASRITGMSPLQALATAIASQVGTGNIVGVAMALLMGGPGAIFWLWVSAILGMSTNFAEAILGQLYKTRTADGHIVGGPAYYIQEGLHAKWLARFFAACFIIALGMIGIMVQANSISSAVVSIFPHALSPLWVGVALALFVGGVLSGGIARIASFAESVVPLMAGFFMIGCLIYIGMHASALPGAVADILKYAFTPKAGVGGAAGIAVMTAVRYGISRGLFSNEAGLGTTPHAHAIAKVRNSYEQGMMAVIGISVDLLVCTFTGLVLLLSGVLDAPDGMVGIQLMQAAFCGSFGSMGNWFIALSLFFFAMSTVVGWYFFAAQNVRYLFGEAPVRAYRYLVMALVVAASVIEVPLIWELADTFNFFIVIPNVIAIIWLSPQVSAELARMRKELRLLDRIKRFRKQQKKRSSIG